MWIKAKPSDPTLYLYRDDHLSATAGHDVFLDQEVPELAAPSWVVFAGKAGYRTYLVCGTSGGSRSDFGLSAKTTGLDLASVAECSGSTTTAPLDGVTVYTPPDKPETEPDDTFELRTSVAYVLAKPQTLAPMPYVEPIDDGDTHAKGATEITLDRMVLGLAIGQAVMVSGVEAADGSMTTTGVSRWEVATIDRIVHAAGRTRLTFRQALAYRYVRSTCTINANVILASHGETVASEVLGSGDGAQANQAFVLRKSPLTYVAATNASGAESTLDVKVNGISWAEVPSLYDQSARSQSYVVRHSDDGSATVEFGDGIRGARLPTGQENVIARYRTGIGPDGNVRARALSLLLHPPLGVRSVINPIAASGGAAPEQLAEARSNAPLHVLTLDRIVSLSDFEDFARGFAGVGKARAEAIWRGDRRVVYLSVADASGQELDPALDLYQHLLDSLQSLGDGTDEILLGDTDPASGRLRTFIPRPIKLGASVGVDPRCDAPTVHDQVKAAVASAFGFAARDLGQYLSESEVLLAIQQVAGVVFTRLTQLGDQATPALPDGGVLVAQGAQLATAGTKTWIRPAELLVVSPNAIDIEVAQP